MDKVNAEMLVLKSPEAQVVSAIAKYLSQTYIYHKKTDAVLAFEELQTCIIWPQRKLDNASKAA